MGEGATHKEREGESEWVEQIEKNMNKTDFITSYTFMGRDALKATHIHAHGINVTSVWLGTFVFVYNCFNRIVTIALSLDCVYLRLMGCSYNSNAWNKF